MCNNDQPLISLHITLCAKQLLRYWVRNVITLLVNYYIFYFYYIKNGTIIRLLAVITLKVVIILLAATFGMVKVSKSSSYVRIDELRAYSNTSNTGAYTGGMSESSLLFLFLER